MSYIPLQRDDLIWRGDYVGCGVGLGQGPSRRELYLQSRALNAAKKIPVPPGGGGTTGVLPAKKQLVFAPTGWMARESYKGWSIQSMPDPKYSCPPGSPCKITPMIWRAVQGMQVSPPVGDRALLMRWVDHKASQPDASGPVTVRPNPNAPAPSTAHQQLVIGGGAPAPGDVLVPPGSDQVPKVVVAANGDAPDAQPAQKPKGKGLLTAAGIAAAAYFLLG